MFKKYYASLLNNTLTDEEKKGRISQRLIDVYHHSVSTDINDKMISGGIIWRQRLPLPELSKINLNRLKETLNLLTIDEKDFYERFLNAEFYAAHATNSQKTMNDNNDLILYSRKNLFKRKILFPENNTTKLDIDVIASDDNVFFSLEVGIIPSKNPIEGKGSRFGNTIYKIPFTSPVFDFSSMVLFDQISLQIPRCNINGLSPHAKGILESRSNPHPRKICFYNRKDILNSIALSIINESRKLPEKDKKIILKASSDKEFNDILRSFFRIEIRVPKMVGIRFGQYFRFHFGAK